jgi:ABC-type Fe3+ transport system permease subunit
MLLMAVLDMIIIISLFFYLFLLLFYYDSHNYDYHSHYHDNYYITVIFVSIGMNIIIPSEPRVGSSASSSPLT